MRLKLPRRRWVRWLLSLILLFLLFGGRFLVCYDEPVPADMMLVLMGDRKERSLVASHIYQQGFVRKLAFVVPFADKVPRPGQLKEQQDLIFTTFRFRGIDSADIQVLPGPASSTLLEAMYFADYCARRPEIKRVLVVSSSLHARRASFIFGDVFRRRGLRTELVFPRNTITPYNEWCWWSSAHGIRWTLSEYSKFVYYLFWTRWVGPDKPPFSLF